MTMLLVWVACGCLVGAMAAERRGFSMPVGLIAGGLLGVLSPLLLVVEPNASTRICPACSERVKIAAVVCRYCRTELEPIDVKAQSASKSLIRVAAFSVGGVVLILGTLMAIGMIVRAFS